MVESRSSFFVDECTVAVAGTPVSLPKHIVGQGCEVVIRAKKTNTGLIKVGDSSASAIAGKLTLDPGEAVKLRIADTSIIFIDAEVSGEKVELIAEG